MRKYIGQTAGYLHHPAAAAGGSGSALLGPAAAPAGSLLPSTATAASGMFPQPPSQQHHSVTTTASFINNTTGRYILLFPKVPSEYINPFFLSFFKLNETKGVEFFKNLPSSPFLIYFKITISRVFCARLGSLKKTC